jgi:hypothetical protein
VIIALSIVGLLLVVVTVFATALSVTYANLEERVNRLAGSAGSSVAVGLSPRPAPVPTGVGGETGRAAQDLVGVTLDGGARSIRVVGTEHFSLLAFLSSGCKSCGRFWDGLRHDGLPGLGADTRLVVVTKGPEAESPTELSRVAGSVEFLMSTEAWTAFEVPGTPFFVLVDGAKGTVVGEGTSLGWDEVRNLVALGRGDASILTGVDTSAMKPASDAERETLVDQVLMDAGIFPGDPSLYQANLQDPPAEEAT